MRGPLPYDGVPGRPGWGAVFISDWSRIVHGIPSIEDWPITGIEYVVRDPSRAGIIAMGPLKGCYLDD